MAEKLNAPECMQLCRRRFEIKEALLGSWRALAGSGSQALFFLEDAWVMVLQLPAFPSGEMYFGLEETPGAA